MRRAAGWWFQRILPYWQDHVAPSLREGRTVLIAAHNNVIRCLVTHIDELPKEMARDIEIPQASPLMYILDRKTLKSTREKRGEDGISGVFLKDMAGSHQPDQTHPSTDRTVYYAKPLPLQLVLPQSTIALAGANTNGSRIAGGTRATSQEHHAGGVGGPVD